MYLPVVGMVALQQFLIRGSAQSRIKLQEPKCLCRPGNNARTEVKLPTANVGDALRFGQAGPRCAARRQKRAAARLHQRPLRPHRTARKGPQKEIYRPARRGSVHPAPDGSNGLHRFAGNTDLFIVSAVLRGHFGGEPICVLCSPDTSIGMLKKRSKGLLI